MVSPEAIRNGNLAAVRTNLDQVLAWIPPYEFKEATTLVEFALWKARIEDMGAVMDEARSAFCVDALGLAKDTFYNTYNKQVKTRLIMVVHDNRM